MSLQVHIVTLFPRMFDGWLKQGGVGRAIARDAIQVEVVDLRPFGLGNHLQVDDAPFGGGPGMVLRPEPLFEAVESIRGAADGPVVLTSPRGRVLTQQVAVGFSQAPRLTIIAGHYEGVDERVSGHLATDEVSIGDYVLSGGELAAMVVVDAVARLLPGAIDEESHTEESFTAGLLEYPQYTRPASFRGWDVPEVLLSGNHGLIAKWRREQAKNRTEEARPDLLGQR